jgi:Domain of unknown function (DUF5615)
LRAKLDENFGVRGEALLHGRGWDVATVDGQELSSVTDETLIEICRVENRAVVSFDKDFADVVHFPPVRYRGIIRAAASGAGDATEDSGCVDESRGSGGDKERGRTVVDRLDQPDS